jgi:hypothetical protein
MNLVDLDSATRAYMRAEVERDIAAGTLYLSDRLNSAGLRQYPIALLDAIDHGTPASFATAIRLHGLLNRAETAIKGRPPDVVPLTAADALAEGEFNRFYMRGVCARAVAGGVQRVEVYQAQVRTEEIPLRESGAMIGRRLDAQGLLDDLRRLNLVDRALGLPSGVDSGLSVWFPGVSNEATEHRGIDPNQFVWECPTSGCPGFLVLKDPPHHDMTAWCRPAGDSDRPVCGRAMVWSGYLERWHPSPLTGHPRLG